jgi:CBS domain-containing protein
MTKRLICIEPKSTAIEAARIILKKKIGALPVTESDKTLLGIVSVVDLLAMARSLFE